MSVGEVEESDFEHSFLAKSLYALFIMTVVILLANILAYLIGNEIYQHEHHAIQFWTNRLEFVLALDEISSAGPFRLLRRLQWDGEGRSRRLCQQVLSLFDDKQLNLFTCQFCGYAVVRAATVFIVFPCWFWMGFATAGYLWPPQFREYIFYAPHSLGGDGNQQDQGNEVHALKNEVASLKAELRSMEKKLDEILNHCRDSSSTGSTNMKRTVPIQG